MSLETATRAGSIAVMRAETVVASYTGISDESHSTNLLSRIQAILDEAEVRLGEIDLFATASGPGSFTGLRIGLATIKAFAVTLNRPCVGVATLEAIAFAGGASRRTHALLPAGRGELFAQAFEVGDGKVAGRMPALPGALSEAEHIPPQVLLERNHGRDSIHWAGPGAHLYRDAIHERATELGIDFVEGPAFLDSLGGNARWTLAPNEEQLAQYVAILAYRRANSSESNRAEDLRAIYVRPSDAELNK